MLNGIKALSAHSLNMNSPIRKTHPLLKVINWSIVDLPAPLNLSYAWNFGSLLGLCLIIQILTGIILAIHYTPNIDFAFSSCAHIRRDVNYGWLIRNTHANGASIFFICIYLHIGRRLYFSSYYITEVWNIGIILFLLTIGSAFLGYVLPWGQIRFWGATVITNLLSAIPYIGKILVTWIWGGFALDNATLNRFFTFHFVVPFLILAITVIHLLFLHQSGSNNPIGISSNENKTPFHWLYSSKDILGILVLTIGLIILSLFFPFYLGDPDNWVPANPLQTPIHIKPEWYFLWAYAILRSIPNKLGGVIAIFAAIIILFVVPYLYLQTYASLAFYPLSQILFWSFTALFMLLTWIGGRPIETPFDTLGQLFTTFYFILFFLKPFFLIVWDKLLK